MEKILTGLIRKQYIQTDNKIKQIFQLHVEFQQVQY